MKFVKGGLVVGAATGCTLVVLAFVGAVGYHYLTGAMDEEIQNLRLSGQLGGRS